MQQFTYSYIIIQPLSMDYVRSTIPTYIELKCKDEVEFFKNIFNSIFCSDLTELIISYLIFSHHWILKKTIDKIDFCEIFNKSTIVTIERLPIQKPITFNYSGGIVINQTINVQNIYYDDSYIYVLINKTIWVIDYNDKSIFTLLVCTTEYYTERDITENISKHILYIRNNIIYIQKYDCCVNQLNIYNIKLGRIDARYSIESINVYFDCIGESLFTSERLLTSYDCKTINNMYYDGNEFVIVLELDLPAKLLPIRTSDGTIIWCINSEIDTKVTYCDEKYIMYTRNGYIGHIHKADGRVCENKLKENYADIQLSNHILILKTLNRACVYERLSLHE